MDKNMDMPMNLNLNLFLTHYCRVAAFCAEDEYGCLGFFCLKVKLCKYVLKQL